jgi:hypothetical protein
MGGQRSRRSIAGPAAVVLLAATVVLAAACGGATIPGGTRSESPVPLPADRGWVAAGGADFRPAPFGRTSLVEPGGATLVAATGEQARVKWLAERAAVATRRDARSALTVRVVDVTDPSARAVVRFQGAGGAGSADLPIDPGKRTVYRITWSATGSYRRCAVLIEVRTPGG